jgi:Cys-tRNA(Pro)/Cys-tRNA(Cys) deacylase
MITNNVTRFLDSKKIEYSIFELPVEKLGAIETAEYLRIPVEIVFKTIVVVRSKGKPILCMVPGNSKVDLKAVAEILGEKKVSVPTMSEAEKLTGLEAGGISPLALLNKGFVFLLDSSAISMNAIHISGGQRGLNIKLAVDDLVLILNPKIASITI